MGRDTEDKSIDLRRVQKRFAAALPSYNDNAHVQKQIARQLLAMLLAEGRTDFARVLEYGCGTGLFTQIMSEGLSVDSWLLNDLVPDCAKYIAVPNVEFVPGPAEDFEPVGPFDLIASASAFQWFADPAQLLSKLSGKLAAHGRLLFNTFLPENLYELTSLSNSTLPYLAERELVEMLQADYEILSMQAESFTLCFDSLYELLLHLRSTGVTATSNSNRVWTASQFAELESKYRSSFADSEGRLLLTYKPLLFLCAARSV